MGTKLDIELMASCALLCLGIYCFPTTSRSFAPSLACVLLFAIVGIICGGASYRTALGVAKILAIVAVLANVFLLLGAMYKTTN